MHENKLIESPAEARDNYEQMLADIEMMVEATISGEDDVRAARLILEDMQERTERFLKRKFRNSDNFRQYLHTRIAVIKSLLGYKGESIAPTEKDKVKGVRKFIENVAMKVLVGAREDSDDAEEMLPKASYKDELLVARGGLEAPEIGIAVTDDGKPVVLKLLSENADPDVREFFHNEQRVLANLHLHYGEKYPPNLLKPYAFAEGLTTTEYVPGAKNLDDVIEQQPKSEEVGAELVKRIIYFEDIVTGLNDLYAAGHLFHGDLKPKNCIRDKNGRVVVCDFSLVDHHRGKPQGKNDAICGTPRYMPAERCFSIKFKDEPVIPDQRVDVYALGVTLYNMLTCGTDPYGRDTDDDLSTYEEIIIANQAVMRKQAKWHLDDGKVMNNAEIVALIDNYPYKPLNVNNCPFLKDQAVLDALNELILQSIKVKASERPTTPQELLLKFKKNYCTGH